MNTESPASLTSRRIVRGLAAYGTGDVLTGVVRLGLTSVYTAALQPGDFGIMTLLYVTVTLAVTSLPVGLPDVMMVRFGTRGRGVMRPEMHLVYTSLLVFWAVGAAVVGLLWGVGAFSATVSSMVPWCVVWALAGTLWFVPAQSLRFREQPGRYSLSRVAHVLVLLGVVMVYYRQGTLSVSRIVMAEALGAVAALVVVHLADGYLPRLVWPSQWRTLLKLGVPFCLLASGHFVVDWADRYVVTAMLGAEATGYYAVAGRLAIAGSMLAMAFNSLWQPFFYRHAGEGAMDQGAMRRAARRMVLFASAGLALLTVFVPMLVDMDVRGWRFIHPSYAVARVLVAPLLLHYFFKIVYYVATPSINFHQRTWRQVWILVGVAVLNLVGNAAVIALVPSTDVRIPLLGVALVTVVSYVVAMVLGLRELRDLYPDAYPGTGFVTACGVVMVGVTVVG